MKSLLLKTLFLSVIFFQAQLSAKDKFDIKNKPNEQLIKQLQSVNSAKRIIVVRGALIQNASQLDQILAIRSPLDQLSDESKQRFVDRLVFGKKSLGSFYYGDLERELSPLQIYKILSLFGYQDFTSKFTTVKSVSTADALIMSSVFTISDSDQDGFLLGYLCQSAGTCMKNNRYACTSNC